MDFFTLLTPDGVPLETFSILVVVGVMFLYTFVGICAGFGGGLTSMPLITMVLPLKMAAPCQSSWEQVPHCTPLGYHAKKQTGNRLRC